MDHHEESSPQQQQQQQLIGGYSVLSKLGSGSFATVYKAVLVQAPPRHHDDEPSLPEIAAIKSIPRTKKLTPKVLSNLQIEISILRSHRHPNIVRLFHVVETDDVASSSSSIHLVLEYCRGGDLQRLLRSRIRSRLSERLCRRILRDLAHGLKYMWERSLVHRDIKPQNLLLTCALPREERQDNPPKDENDDHDDDDHGDAFAVKIADFGFARHLGGVDLAETMCGSPLYMAPEILLGQKYDAKADLWSVGTVLFEMISGRTPFHGENHMDLLHNMKRKAVRLPPDVRVSKECVALLRMLLDRRPASRADFTAFYGAAEKFVALGCLGGGTMEGLAVPHGGHVGGDGNEEVMPLQAQMDLCAITEDEGGEEEMGERPCDWRPSQGPREESKETLKEPQEDLVAIVTPPFQPIMAPPPPSHWYAGGIRNSHRPSVFAPLQGSPNLSPTATPLMMNIPTLSLHDGGAVVTDSRSLPLRIQQRDGFAPSMTGEHSNSARSESQPSSSSIREAYDSGFVLVEHSNHRSRPGSTNNSPSNSIPRAPHSPNTTYQPDSSNRSPSTSPKYSSGRRILTCAAGMLGTSPATGQALVGKMMRTESPTATSGTSLSTGKFNLSPRTALRNGGCLAHIESLARMLAAAEDIGRRAISVAHLGDVRAYLAMGILVALRDGSTSSSSSCTPMELDEEGNGKLSLRGKVSRKTIVEEEEEEEEELPFAMTSSMEDPLTEEMAQSPAGNIMSNLAPLIGNNEHTVEHSSNNEDLPTAVRLRFREALLCYLKTLSMMKGAICAAQKVLKDVEEVVRLPSIRPSPNSNNPYTPLHKRCSGSLEWLRGQFSAVLERANAASDQISKLEKATNSQRPYVQETVVSVEELIYNHSLKCGSDGTVQQILGHYDAARSCYRSAGLLAETLLMDPKVGDEDRTVLEGYVHSFADQIMELDGLIQMQRRSSRTLNVPDAGGSVLGVRRQSPAVVTNF
ncbi:hypothetical protein ACHAWX_003841 [Stephanocyclus meneghinianus]